MAWMIQRCLALRCLTSSHLPCGLQPFHARYPWPLGSIGFIAILCIRPVPSQSVLLWSGPQPTFLLLQSCACPKLSGWARHISRCPVGPLSFAFLGGSLFVEALFIIRQGPLAINPSWFCLLLFKFPVFPSVSSSVFLSFTLHSLSLD